ncbi:MAG: transposase [Aphanocapsa lilacina HA4352-LM1]|nr:transposase [Aphanocapsa lilacina HA4352-LM1]
MRDRAEQWWPFLSNPRVRPDNNLSERTWRLAVTKRQVSGESRSRERFTQTADLLSVIETCRRQGRSAIEFFVEFFVPALQAAHQAGFVMPSLIPETQT